MTLSVDVVSAFPLPQSAAPGIGFRLRIEETSGACVHAIALRCHTRIEPRSRHYTTEERARLYELFGHRSQWDRTLRGVTWSQSSLVVPTFTGQIEIDLHVPCTYDLEVASAKYFHAIRDGEVPLVFLFSGTIFNAGDAGLRVEPVPWDLEASFRMPARLWTSAMDQFFPGGGWLRLSRETIDRLQAFRGRQAVVSWDEAIVLLLEAAAAGEPA